MARVVAAQFAKWVAMNIPPAPWNLTGSGAAFWIAPLRFQLWVKYDSSPVGAYDEHALAKLTMRGPHVYQMSVNAEASMQGGRAIWGFPKMLEELGWERRASRAVFRRGAREFRLRICGPSIPFWLPFWCVQEKGFVPGTLRGRARLCRSNGRVGVWIEDFEMKIAPPIRGWFNSV